MDRDSPQPDFRANAIDPALLSRGNPNTSALPHDLTSSLAAPGEPSWDSGCVHGGWVTVAKDFFADEGWSEYANHIGPGFQQNMPYNGSMPVISDDSQGQLTESWGREAVQTFNNREESQSSPDFHNQTCTKLDDSSQPFQSALQPDLEGDRLNSSKAPSHTSSDTGSPIRTPTSSEDEVIQAVPVSQHTHQKAPSAPSSRKRRPYEIKGMTWTFPIREGQPPHVRIRKSYTPGRRKQVALIRQMGACPRCRFRKVAVSRRGQSATNTLN